MKAGEIQALKDLVDKILPAVEQAEVDRLPAAYRGIVSVVVAALGPSIQAKLDEVISTLPVDPPSAA
jgi:hypothetical protein